MPYELEDALGVRTPLPASLWPRQRHVGGQPDVRFVRGYGSADWYRILDGGRESEALLLTGVIQTDRDEMQQAFNLEDLEAACQSAVRIVRVDHSGVSVEALDLLGALPPVITPDGVDGTLAQVEIALLPAQESWAPLTVPDEGPDGTRFYVEITIPAQAATLTNYPVFLPLELLPAGFWTRVAGDGRDVRITLPDGETVLPRDLVSIDSVQETGELHFLAPSLSASEATVFRVYYGSLTATAPAPAAPTGRNAVWQDYFAVYHMSGTGSAGEVNAAGNAHDLVANGALDTATGAVGTSRAFTSSRYLQAAETASLGQPTAITLQAWQRHTMVTTATSAMPLTVGAQWFWFAASGTAAAADKIHASVSGTISGLSAYGSGLNDGAWHDVHVTNEGGQTRVYVDGSLVTSPSFAQAISQAITGRTQVSVGANWNGTSGYPNAGTAWLDEIRVRFTALTAEWIAAEYENQHSPATFLTIGAEQPA